MKEALIILYTPDMSGPQAKDCIRRLTQTDLSRAELLVYDRANADAGRHEHDDAANRQAALKNLSAFAGQRRVVVVDENTAVEDPRWLDKLLNASDENGRRA
jgi:hypothetical protein